MIAMNARAKLDKVPEARIAADFASVALRRRFGRRHRRRRAAHLRGARSSI